ncbi:Radical SAM domain protein [Ruminiclostridium papyrosolvens DSM 2782]|uniref:Radical SAM domain protein n=1 Tax=Ruminiclostridium papyrosolvens DSM 2782 TaxID=588581 RepID=F1TF66_9FIRM|nr:radical SAM protein [Ruminiclostridium papyrosolvens]EGD47004.1 Radical SAM domain protein [Ruminiclostridium papyrosolvens DSM 2782]WES33747.1 radical SAM protein [Ruminiclostridium papyrosolvens DSM 2782]
MKSLSVHLTDQCNNSCKFCVVNSYQGQQEHVNLKVVFKYLEENAKNGYESVNIHGGEPTIIPELILILDKIKALGYPTVSLQTNARMLSNIEFTKELATRGVDLFVVSIHGKDANMHDFFTTVEGSFEEAVKGIKNVKALGKKVRTNTVVCKQNYSQLKDIINFVIDIGVDHVNISSIHPTGKAFENFHLVVPKLSECISSVEEAVDTAIGRNMVVTLEGYPPCMLGEYNKYVIGWDDIHFKLLFHNIVLQDYEVFMKNETRRKGDPCNKCVHASKCGGVYKEYVYYYGWDEFKPVISED